MSNRNLLVRPESPLLFLGPFSHCETVRGNLLHALHQITQPALYGHQHLQCAQVGFTVSNAAPVNLLYLLTQSVQSALLRRITDIGKQYRNPMEFQILG